MTDTSAPIRQKIAAFVTEIETLTRQAALDAVRVALSGTPPTPASRANGRRVARRAATKAAPKPASGKRTKRTTEDVAEVGATILAFVKSNPGCSSERIQAGLGLAKKDVALPILRLREEKRLKTTGQKRGTKYFAGGEAAKAAAPVKRAAPKARPVAAKKKRKLMSAEQKAALLERLARARTARAVKLAAKR